MGWSYDTQDVLSTRDEMENQLDTPLQLSQKSPRISTELKINTHTKTKQFSTTRSILWWWHLKLPPVFSNMPFGILIFIQSCFTIRKYKISATSKFSSMQLDFHHLRRVFSFSSVIHKAAQYGLSSKQRVPLENLKNQTHFIGDKWRHHAARAEWIHRQKGTNILLQRSERGMEGHFSFPPLFCWL